MAPDTLIRAAVKTIPLLPLLLRWVAAKYITKELLKLMPTTPIALSISDPISAMVCAALNFLSTPAGQKLVIGLEDAIKDLISHVHASTPKPAPVVQ